MALLHYNPPTFPAIDVLFQDEHIIVLNKPSGLLSVPGKALEHRDCLQYRVQRVWPTATIVHRLDMATSGLMIMAMNKASHRHISKQFETRQIKKTYFARVYGKPESQKGTIELPLICDWPNRPKQMVDHENGKAACTHWQVLSTDNNSSLVQLNPITGRSHQLRVHMLSMGHPILGDRLYAHDVAKAMSERLNLHAAEITFEHPYTQSILNFTCPHTF